MPLYYHKLNSKALDEYKSSGLTMPSDGLVFYASLKNSINAESGHDGNSVVQSYEFVTENGIQCIKSNSNNAAIQYPTWSEITGNNSLSISFWMKGKCEHQDDNIITYGTWATDSLRAARFMGSGTSALLGCEAGDDFTSGGIKTTDNDGNPKWMHIVVIFEDLNDEFEYRVYGNTTLGYIKHRSAVNTLIDDSRRGLWLFSKTDLGESHYNGCICALRVYNRVLSQEEITTLSQEFIPKIEYQSTGTDEFGHSIEYNSAFDAFCNYFPIPKEGLLLKALPNRWDTINGINVSKWGDFEQNEQSKQPIVKTIDGITGINPDSGDTLSGTAETLSGNFSFVSKIYIGTTDTSKSFIFIRNDWHGVGFGLCDGGGNDHLYITHIGHSSLETDINLSIGVHIVAVTYNISDGETKFYVDGKLKYIGNYSPGFTYSSNYYTCEGNIQEDLILWVAAYNRILTKEEIKSFSIKKENDYLVFHLNALSGFTDLSKNPCTIINSGDGINDGVTINGDSFIFDGENYLEINKVDKLNFGLDDFTIEIIMNLSTANEERKYPAIIGRNRWME